MIQWVGFSMDANLAHISIEILSSARTVLTPATWRQQGLNRPYARLFAITTGRGRLSAHGQDHVLVPGRVYLIPPRGDLSYACDADMDCRFLLFKATLLGCIDLFDYLPGDFVRTPEVPAETIQDLDRLLVLAAKSGPVAQIGATGLLLTLMAPFFRAGVRPGKRQGMLRLLPVLRHIEAHVRRRPSVGELAGVIGLQEAHFATQFRRIIGLPPAKYVNRQRIELVQTVLRSGDDTLERIARDFSFADAFHLSKAFKRETGISPQEFRRAYQVSPTNPGEV